MVAYTFNSGSINPSLDDTLIVTIPKVDNPSSMKDFKPISLCNEAFKIVYKVLVNMIMPFLDTIIRPFQSSFIPKRGTMDNVVIAQEIAHHMHKKKGKSGYLMYKIDFEKAYDMVDWNFLKLTLTECGFPQKLIDFIMSCTTTTSLSLKWNSEILDSFSPTRGLKKSDPMSPYLFVLCMENLALLIQEKVQANLWEPIKISSNGLQVSHFFFTNDCNLFTKANATQVHLVNQVLQSFCKVVVFKVSLNLRLLLLIILQGIKFKVLKLFLNLVTPLVLTSILVPYPNWESM